MGKSRLARRLTTIRPAMRLADALETTRLHRLAGRTGARTALVTTRPCRAPPHPSSYGGWMGGGKVPMPGAVSLAHHGVLREVPSPERVTCWSCSLMPSAVPLCVSGLPKSGMANLITVRPAGSMRRR